MPRTPLAWHLFAGWCVLVAAVLAGCSWVASLQMAALAMESQRQRLADLARGLAATGPDGAIDAAAFEGRARDLATAAGVEAALLGPEGRPLDGSRAADGLPDPDRKPPLPAFPRRVGLVTGRASDAEADVVRALADRFPPVRMSVAHALVQGVEAVNSLIDALGRLASEPEVDVIVLARGGGSVEDLLPFSDERLCRAIAALDVPVVTSIGHTRQRPNCDFVAAAAAEVPARAAERVVPSAAELAAHVARTGDDIAGGAAAALERAGARVERSAMRPAGQAALRERTGRIDLAGQALGHAAERATGDPRERLLEAGGALGRALGRVPRAATLDAARARLEAGAVALRHRLELGERALGGALGLIRARDWRERGFALVRLPDGRLVRDARDLGPGQAVTIELGGGTLEAEVRAVRPDDAEDGPA